MLLASAEFIKDSNFQAFLNALFMRFTNVLKYNGCNVTLSFFTDAHWASMNLGIVLCLKCAGKLNLSRWLKHLCRLVVSASDFGLQSFWFQTCRRWNTQSHSLSPFHGLDMT